MRRFFGMMPRDEVSITTSYRDSNNLPVIIEAGNNGWTIRFADYSTKYRDKVDTVENNFNEAYRTATEMLGNLTKDNVK